MGKSEPPICSSCNLIITVKHVLIHCQLFTQAREEHAIPNNLYEAIEPYTDPEKIISFLKKS